MSDELLPPIKEIPFHLIMKIAAYHGFAHFILVARREGDEGATSVTYGGISARDRLIAEAIAGDIQKNVLGWESSEEAKALDKMVAEAKKEMQEGPDADTSVGSKIILPTISKIKEVDGPKHDAMVAQRAKEKAKEKKR